MNTKSWYRIMREKIGVIKFTLFHFKNVIIVTNHWIIISRITYDFISVRYCPELTNGDIAYIFPNISLSPPDGKVKVKCIAGHVVKGSRVLSCTTDGTWNQSPLPSCKKYGMFIRLIWYV